MDSLDKTEWDVVIYGTGLPQSLLALALSRSGTTVLHLDPSSYYGGQEAALSLAEADAWAERHKGDSAGVFSHAAIQKAELGGTAGGSQLSPRAYSLALAPHLIYSRSTLIDVLISSQTHTQLEFQAAGSWFIINPPLQGSSYRATLTRVPGGREDIFQDDRLQLKEKRALMKFLRFVAKYEEEPETWQRCASTTFPAFLQECFNLPPNAHAPILALAMKTTAPAQTSIEVALAGIARHLRSIGYFGPGFGAVLPKWGGLAEIGQVACRACAVGGGVYVLGRAISATTKLATSKLTISLDNDESVTTRWLIGSDEAFLPVNTERAPTASEQVSMSRSISIISSPLSQLFPQTAEGGVIPAGAVIFVPSASIDKPPVYMFAHSSESGECPHDQCVVYACVAQSDATSFSLLEGAVRSLLQSTGEPETPQVLWRMNYRQRGAADTSKYGSTETNSHVINLPQLPASLVLEDDVLESVTAAWQRITSSELESFMKFEARGVGVDDD